MQGEFTDVAGAVKWITEQVLWHFPDSDGELFLDPRGPFNPKRHRSDLKTLLTLFAEFCNDMPQAWIRYEPGHPYGIICKVVGHCECPDGECRNACRKYDERPHVILTITRTGQNEVLLGGFRGTGKGGGI